MIRDIYRRDNKIRETAKNDEETVRLRKEELTPLFEEFHSWLKEKETHCLASNKFGEAVSYTLKRWDKLKEFMNCAEMTPDNNLAENAIRPFVLGNIKSQIKMHKSCGIKMYNYSAKATQSFSL